MTDRPDKKLVIIGDQALCNRDQAIDLHSTEQQAGDHLFLAEDKKLNDALPAYPFHVPDLCAIAWRNRQRVEVGFIFQKPFPPPVVEWRIEAMKIDPTLVITKTSDIRGAVTKLQNRSNVDPANTIFITNRPTKANAVIASPVDIGADAGHGLIKATLEKYIPDYMDGFLSRTVPEMAPDPPPGTESIRMIFFDKDGTLTNGIKYARADGVVANRFYCPDLHAIRQMRKEGQDIGIITGDRSQITARLAQLLDIPADATHVQADEAKIDCMRRSANIYGHDLSNVAFVGDSYNDIGPMIDLINAGGQAFCPADAEPAVRDVDGVTVLQVNGGSGVAVELAGKI